jgi:hypothetical protein
MSNETARALWEFKKLAEAFRSKSTSDGVLDTELELVYEACASSVERVIIRIQELFK